MSETTMEQLQESDWHYENITPDLIQVERVTKVLYEGRTAYQHVLVQDTACFGRSLVLDGKTQSTEIDEFVYHEALVHPSMLAHPEPQQVFIAGGGEGATLREVLSHKSVTKAVMVDIDSEVVALCRQHLPNHHRGAFDDPRLELHHTDALKFLEETEDRFDVVIIDVPDPLEQGPAYMLFTQEFYYLLKDRLKPRGLMVAQSGPTGPAFYEQCFSAVAKTIGTVFPAVYVCEAFIPSFGTTWGFVIGSLEPDPTALSTQDIDSRIAERINGQLRYYDGITQRGMFSVPKYLRDAVVRETRTITQANPLFVV
jgi:spermidine synthase